MPVATHAQRKETPGSEAASKGSARLPPRPYGLSFADSHADSIGAADAAVGETIADLPVLGGGRSPPIVQRMCAGCGDDDKRIRRKTEGAREPVGTQPEPAKTSVFRAPGEALAPAARDFLSSSPAGSRPSAAFVQRKCTACELDGQVQPQLEVGRADDPLEAEADAMADHVVGQLAGGEVRGDASAGDAQAKGEEGASQPSATASFGSGVTSSGGSGAPLEDRTRGRMEEAFGADFSGVRVHVGAKSSAMCDEIGARAFTYGSDIHFNEGEFAPGTERGTRLLAHELTHVVQQNDNVRRAPRRIQRMQLGPRVFGPTSKMPTGTTIHNVSLLDLFVASNTGLLKEPAVPGANKGLVGSLLTGYPDLYRDKSSGAPIGLKEAPEKPFSAINGAEGAPKPPLKSGPVRDIGRAPTDIEVGDVKPGHSAEELLGKVQLDNYIKGIKNTTKAVNGYQSSKGFTDKWTHSPGTPKPMKELAIPDKVKAPAASGVGYGPLAVYEWVGKWWWRSGTELKGSCIVYKSKVPGIWSYEWMPVSVPESTGSKAITKSVLDRLEKEVKPRLFHSGKKKAPKLKERSAKRPPAVSRMPARRMLQRQEKHEKFDDAGWNKAYGDWRGDAEKVLQDPKGKADVNVLETLSAAKDRTGYDPGIPQAVTERTKGVETVRHWVRFGRLYGWFRKTFDGVYLKVAAFAKKVKEKFKNLAKKAGSSGFGNWIKAAALALWKVAKKLGAFVMSKVMDLLVESLSQGVMNALKKLAEAATPESVKSKIEEVEELKSKYGDMLEEAQESLEQKLFGDKLKLLETMEKVNEVVSLFGTIVDVVRWGIRIVACASPPLLGCLWNLAMAALEYAFSKIMETCWFSAKVAGWVNDLGIKEFINFPTNVASYIAKSINGLLPLPEGIGPLFAPIEIKEKFEVDCHSGDSDSEAGGGGGAEPTAEQKALIDLAREVGTEKMEAFLAMAAARAADQNIVIDAAKIAPLIRNLTVEQMKAIAEHRPVDGVPVSVEEFLKRIATLTPDEAKRKEERKIDYEKAKRSNASFERNEIKWKPELFVREGVASDSKEFADAVYDIQKMLGMKADGMAGPSTTKAFYEKNNQKKDGAYDNAVKLVEAADQAAAERKADAAKRKEAKELLKDPAVLAALKDPFPTEDQLKKDLQSIDWSQRIQFMVINGRPVVAFTTTAGARVGAYFHYAEKEFQKRKMKMIVSTSRFYAVTSIAQGDDIAWSTTAPDASVATTFNMFAETKAGEFFDFDAFITMFVDF